MMRTKVRCVCDCYEEEEGKEEADVGCQRTEHILSKSISVSGGAK